MGIGQPTMPAAASPRMMQAFITCAHTAEHDSRVISMNKYMQSIHHYVTASFPDTTRSHARILRAL